MVLQQVHDSPLGGHLGYLKTLHRLQKDFYWFGLRQELKQYVRECDVCQKLKHETCFLAGLLQPLPILDKPWLDVSMDFVEGLPKLHLKFVVFVVVDRLTKYTHFMALSHPYFATMVANSICILCSSCMVCPSLLLVRGILCSPLFFGRN